MEICNFEALESDKCHKWGKTEAKGGQKHKIDNKMQIMSLKSSDFNNMQ